MSTFSGILSGQADQAPFWFPWAYHGTREEHLVGISQKGLLTDPDYMEELAFWRAPGRPAKKLPVLYFGACPSVAAAYAGAWRRKGTKIKGRVLRFPWPDDARAWSSERDRASLVALHVACTTGVIPPFTPYRSYGRLRKNWWWVNKDGGFDRTRCEDEATFYAMQYVSAKVVPPRLIEVYTGGLTKAMMRDCDVNDTRYDPSKWVPLLDYVSR